MSGASPVETRTTSAAYLKRCGDKADASERGDSNTDGVTLCIIKKNSAEAVLGGKELPANVLYLVPESLADGASKEIVTLVERLENWSGNGGEIPPRWIALDQTLAEVWEFWDALRGEHTKHREREERESGPPTAEEQTAADVLKLLALPRHATATRTKAPARSPELAPGAQRAQRRRTAVKLRYDPLCGGLSGRQTKVSKRRRSESP